MNDIDECLKLLVNALSGPIKTALIAALTVVRDFVRSIRLTLESERLGVEVLASNAQAIGSAVLQLGQDLTTNPARELSQLLSSAAREANVTNCATLNQLQTWLGRARPSGGAEEKFRDVRRQLNQLTSQSERLRVEIESAQIVEEQLSDWVSWIQRFAIT